ncbi:MAG: tRNA pseudouridine(55) synthase TruB [Bacteroidetes bacterium 4572_128]|nr:MAG: tRNA pseudouridine(55) synthase TruB [Bacteroidetes bacterium 4572_128]
MNKDYKFNFQEGEVLLIDKPLKWSSFDIVKKVRYLIRYNFKIKKIKVGHAGTLDPLATGLIILCTGKFTKKISNFQDKRKEYIATIRIGSTTPSFDLETEITKNFPTEHITKDLIKENLKNFLGEIKQYPPIFSAKKIDGQRAYVKARKGIALKMRPSMVNIYELEILSFYFDNKLPTLILRIVCSKGTYIRSFANDFGISLESGAHLIALKRTKIGDYNLEDAIKIKDIENYFNNNTTL